MKPRCTHLTVGRTARYFEIGDPQSDDVWVALHGYGQLASEFVREFDSFAEGRRILAPEGLSRFYGPRHDRVGASWMTREDRLQEIRDYVGYLDAVVERACDDGSHITVLGFSQGGHTACRWVAARPSVRRIVLWGSTLPEDLDPTGFSRALRSGNVWLVAGRDDRFVSEDQLEENVRRLLDLGLKADLVRFEGGHRIVVEVLREILSQSSGGTGESSASPS